MTEDERFWAKVEQVGDCWIWTAATVLGYGHFRSGGRQVKAHRWAYEALVGPIPVGLQIDHLCRNRACVNPGHLEPVPPQINVRRARPDVCREGHPLVPGTRQRYCPICQNAYSRAWKAQRRRSAGIAEGKGAHQKAKTHCVNGHEFTPENTIRRGNFRSCRECHRQANRRSQRLRASRK